MVRLTLAFKVPPVQHVSFSCSSFRAYDGFSAAVAMLPGLQSLPYQLLSFAIFASVLYGV